MPDQSYATHRQYVPGYHFVLLGLVVAIVLAAAVLVYQAFGAGEGRFTAVLILLLSVALGLTTWYVRAFALRAQDRAIRAEESLRYFALTGSLPDPRITVRQFVGLRFAPDGELVELHRRAADEGLTEDRIKREIREWRGDSYRV